MVDVPVICEGSLPEYKTQGAACMDLVANETKRIFKGKWCLIGTGLYMAIPEGWEGVIRPRSSIAKNNMRIPNSPGTIDADYRGEVKVCIENVGFRPLVIKKFDRIAQFKLQRVTPINWKEVEELPETNRGTGGFGSTGQ